MNGRVTLKDVAAACGVSRSTAGFVLANDPRQKISEETRQRVHQAARDLGYVTHGVARALREGSSRVVVLEIDWIYEGNYSRSYIRGLSAELDAHDYDLLVRHGPVSPGATQRILDSIAPRAMLRFAEPYLTGRDLEDTGGGWVDGLAAHVALQINYLADKGHERIALALPETHTPLVGARRRLTLQHAGSLGLPEPVCFDIPADRDAARTRVERFRRENPQVSAVAAFTDDVALRAVTALRDLGATVPDDLAVMGYDDTEYGALVTPALSSVHIDAEVHGRRVARQALGLGAEGIATSAARVVARESA
ncbi:LacI family DNA-binding transcriptional regulator [Actinospica robiniae]|uniref:LacI family DNA-binding transcriptional regulator n=1 Tax=Actinospica robiniae TaxID=304901 RepID=UPI00041514BA|nr:LacI family DNA-binding transcriptional regulator [Actinospica robiniae]